MSIFAIGDIHGCKKSLKAIFRHQSFSNKDTIIFLGDYVDRGPNSKGVINFIQKQAKTYQCHFLRGNHEIMMMESRTNRRKMREWLGYGGAETLESYKVKGGSNWVQEVDKAHWNFLEKTLPYYVIDPYIFVHAGLEYNVPLEKQDEKFLFWKKFQVPEPYRLDARVICGHTARKNGDIADFGHTICIDTYAYGGMWLTCLNVETKEFIKANDQGEVIKGQL